MRWIGGGDAKLLSALALWTGISQLIELLLVTTMMGGLFALLLWGARRLRPALPGPLSCELLRHGAPIPYGVAIAAGGLLLAPRLPLLI